MNLRLKYLLWVRISGGSENEWPLARTTYQKYYFHSSGNANSAFTEMEDLNTKPPSKENSDKYIYDPANPVRTIGGMGPYDQQQLKSGTDVLVYTTPPLKEDTEVTGPVNALVYASSSARNTDFTAKLVDV